MYSHITNNSVSIGKRKKKKRGADRPARKQEELSISLWDPSSFLSLPPFSMYKKKEEGNDVTEWMEPIRRGATCKCDRKGFTRTVVGTVIS